MWQKIVLTQTNEACRNTISKFAVSLMIISCLAPALSVDAIVAADQWQYASTSQLTMHGMTSVNARTFALVLLARTAKCEFCGVLVGGHSEYRSGYKEIWEIFVFPNSAYLSVDRKSSGKHFDV